MLTITLAGLKLLYAALVRPMLPGQGVFGYFFLSYFSESDIFTLSVQPGWHCAPADYILRLSLAKSACTCFIGRLSGEPEHVLDVGHVPSPSSPPRLHVAGKVGVS